MLLLCVDIGNTSISFGIFKGKKLLKTWRVGTQKLSSLRGAPKGRRSNLNAIIISSVVPKALSKLKPLIKRQFKKTPVYPVRSQVIQHGMNWASNGVYILGENIKVPIKNLYHNPKQVGQDRLVNAVAAVSLYGAPAIVVDFGTAITFDVISKKGEYLGGVIVPGMEISLDALSSRAALLPKIKLSKPKSLLGKDTVDSMLSGIFYGFGSLTDGIAEKLKHKYMKDAKVITTGGHSDMIAPYCKSINHVNKNLTLEGLRIIFEKA